MSYLLELINGLRESGVHLAVDGDRLRYRAPKGVVTEALKQLLAAHKAEIVSLLQTETTTAAREGPPYPDGLGRAKCFYCEKLEIAGQKATCQASGEAMLGIALLKRCSNFSMTTVH